jgi:hypothetical protein
LLKTGFFRQVRELKYKGKIQAMLYVRGGGPQK